MTPVHETAKKGFVRADVYERGRPGYPIDVLDALEITEDTRVCDLGCGTGKFTRLAMAAGADVVGVEPLPAMLMEFHEQMPHASVVSGVAESLPLRDRAVDRVVCASAFHWFDHAQALPEIHRVLKPDGRLGIVWNRRDELTGWPADFWNITEAYRKDTPGYRTGAWRRALDSSPLFGDIDEHWFDHVQRTDVEGLLARVASISFIEILPNKDEVLADARAFLETHPETRGRDEIELPYKTVAYSSVRR